MPFSKKQKINWCLWLLGSCLLVNILIQQKSNSDAVSDITISKLKWFTDEDPQIRSTLIDTPTPFSHAPFVVELPSKNLFCTWFGGSREGGKDVAIFGSTFNIHTKSWSYPKTVTTISETKNTTKRYINSLGNSVLGVDSTNKLILWYTSRLTGWATSSINTMSSEDEGISWSPPKRMSASPFFNLGALVKGTPIPTNNNSWILPIYQELATKYGVLLFVDEQHIIQKYIPLSHGREAIQPVALLSDNSVISVWMRNCHNGPIVTAKYDIKNNTTDYGYSQVNNPDKAISLINLPNQRKLMVANHKSLNSLFLFYMDKNDTDWQPLISLETMMYDENTATYSHSSVSEINKDLIDEIQPIHFVYPSMIRTKSGRIHIAYSWDCKKIRHIEFNDSWLIQLLDKINATHI